MKGKKPNNISFIFPKHTYYKGEEMQVLFLLMINVLTIFPANCPS